MHLGAQDGGPYDAEDDLNEIDEEEDELAWELHGC